MTALSQYDRLEAPALYTPGQGAQRRDVILSIGSASLTVTDNRDVALAHWSLAAVERLNPGRRPALYAPAPDAPERIETADEEMIRAIEKIRQAVNRTRPKPGRVRTRLTLAAIALGGAVAVLWLPDAVTRYTASILPEAARTALGDAALDRVTRLAGAACADPAGRAAMRTLVARLGPSGPARVRVLSASPVRAAHLPGSLVILNRDLVEAYEAPLVAAGHILAETERAAERDPLIDLLEHAGLRATLTLMTTGKLPEDALDGYAEALLTRTPRSTDAALLAERFNAAGVPLAPYTDALAAAGTPDPALAARASGTAADTRILLGDGDWVALQSICSG